MRRNPIARQARVLRQEIRRAAQGPDAALPGTPAAGSVLLAVRTDPTTGDTHAFGHLDITPLSSFRLAP